MEEIINVLDDEFEREVINSDKPVLVDFWASWCMPCKMQGDVLREIAPDLNGKVKIVKVNVDECEKVAGEYGISAIPTLMVFAHGEMQEKSVGLSSKKELSELLLKYM